MTQNSRDRAHRQKYHDFLADHAALPASKQSLKPAAWIITIAWLFFGIGPGAVIGNDIFGSPNDFSTWTFGIPSIWAWHISILDIRSRNDVVLSLQNGNVYTS